MRRAGAGSGRDGKLARKTAESEQAETARLRRIGVIDVGSNSVRLVIFDGVARSPAYVYNEKVMAGLGAGLGETGRLSRDGWRRALGALHRFAALGARMQLSGLIAVATAAVREAEDGPAFCEQAERETGLQLHVASGAEEARLSAKGVLLGWPQAEGLVCDMGGSSMELAHLAGGEIRDCATSPLGPLKLADFKDEEKRERYIRKQVRALRKSVQGEADRLFLVGGSWRAIARLDMERRSYPLTVLHGYELDPDDLADTLVWIRGQSAEEMSARTGLSMARLALVPLATLALGELVRRLEPARITVSAYGLREGLLYRQMPEKVRQLDPLIEGCRHMEAASARSPGFGDALFDWLAPLRAGRLPGDLRLFQAACLLHDVNWRAHPDYRADLCFESTLFTNMAGITHPERVFLSLALLNRYRSAAPGDVSSRYLNLISQERAVDAMILGRAMRLGAMLSGSSIGVLDHAALSLSGDRLELTLTGAGCDFAGDAVERRLQSLAQRLGATPQLTLMP